LVRGACSVSALMGAFVDQRKFRAWIRRGQRASNDCRESSCLNVKRQNDTHEFQHRTTCCTWTHITCFSARESCRVPTWLHSTCPSIWFHALFLFHSAQARAYIQFKTQLLLYFTLRYVILFYHITIEHVVEETMLYIHQRKTK